MPLVSTMNFDAEAFLSYAHLDNANLIEGHPGWIDGLHRKLEIRVGELLGKEPHIWRDPELRGNELFAPSLMDRLHHVAVFLAVVSPRYVLSDWTRKELAEFWKAAERQGGLHVQNKARVFKVMKTKVDLEKQPTELRGLLGYEFFRIDPRTGKVREMNDAYGADEQQAFMTILDDLAQDIKDLLEALEGASLNPSDDREAIFLATTTGDLKEQREAIRRDLLQHGFTVLPGGTLPLDASELESAVRADLARSRMSIHLIGRNYAVVPEGSAASVTEIQNELAIERSVSNGQFSRLLWIPQGLETQDARQRSVIEHLRMDQRGLQSADLLETSLEDLRTAVYTTLARTERAAAPQPVEAPSGLKRVYAMYDPRDADAASPCIDFLFGQHLEVIRPVLEGDEAEVREDHEENLRLCDGVVIFFGAANECWQRRKVREVLKSVGYGRTGPPPVVAICTLPPRTPEKEGLRTHEAIIVPQCDGLGPAAWEPFLSRMKGIEGR
jgi:hypothetical protein